MKKALILLLIILVPSLLLICFWTRKVYIDNSSKLNKEIQNLRNQNQLLTKETEEKKEDQKKISKNWLKDISDNLFCWKNFKALSWWSVIFEAQNEIFIKTNKKDTQWYDVYIKWIDRWNYHTTKSTFYENNINKDNIVRIDCAPWICYAIKINENNICSFDREIYTNQPKPKDFPDNDGAWYPNINWRDKIENEILDMLKTNRK